MQHDKKWLSLTLLAISAFILTACSSQPQTRPIQTKRVVTQTLPRYHIVQQGESLTKIANRYGLDYRRLASLNGLSDSNTIYAGQRLLLTNAPATQILQQTNNTSRFPTLTHISQQTQTWQRPVVGNLIRPFNQASGIVGNWYSAKQGTPVVATQAGTVIYAGNSLPEYGNLIMVQHSNDYISAYAHLGGFSVVEKQQVQAGQKIATVGFVPLLNQPAFEFQLRYRGSPTNPNNFIK